MTLAEFHNGLRALLNVDRDQFPGSGDEWHRFRTDPFRWLIRADDEAAAKLWAVIERQCAR